MTTLAKTKRFEIVFTNVTNITEQIGFILVYIAMEKAFLILDFPVQ